MEKTVRKRRRWAVKSKDRALLLMAMPAIMKIFIFSYLPMIGIVIAFKNYYPIKGIFASPWNGLKNFEFFFVSADAWRILRNTIGLNLLMIITGPVVHITAALLLYTITKPIALKIYQSILFVPHFFSWVLVGLLLTTLIPAAEKSAFVCELEHFKGACEGLWKNTLTAEDAARMTDMIEEARRLSER